MDLENSSESNSQPLTMNKMQEELAKMTAEELQLLKEKLGLKAFRKLFSSIQGNVEIKGSKIIPHRENKNRPAEVSSKRKVGVLRDLPGTKRKMSVHRDPRFDDLSGEFREDIFQRDYSFLKDLKSQEKKKVQILLKKEKNAEKRAKLRQLLNRMTEEEKVAEQKEKKKQLDREWKEKEKKLVKEGKKPFFLKKSDKQKLILADKFKTLKQKGELKNFVQRKRKRNAAKERKKMPISV